VVRTILVSWGVFWVYWLLAARSTQRTVVRENLATRLPHLVLVTLGFFLIFVPGAGSDVRFLPRWIGMLGLVAFAGRLGFALWARQHLGRYWSGAIARKEGHRIVRTGPYRLVRHPIYTGLLVAVLGTAFVLGNVRGFLALVCITLAYAFKIRREEQFLVTEFGDEYRRYRTEVNALMPFVA
jgi:protein-S-isoprenylcysteine O-methyltransferase Ste14